MNGFLVDEDMPRNLAGSIRASGLDGRDVREVGLRGASDQAVFEYAQANALCLISGDLEFGNLLLFPLGSHHGIVLVRFPNEMPVTAMNLEIVEALRQLDPQKLRGGLAVVEPGRVRFRQGP